MSFLDDFRQDVDDSELIEEPKDGFEISESPFPRQHFLGMTPAQRFIIAVMLLMMSCILSVFCLLVTEKIIIPL